MLFYSSHQPSVYFKPAPIELLTAVGVEGQRGLYDIAQDIFSHSNVLIRDCAIGIPLLGRNVSVLSKALRHHTCGDIPSLERCAVVRYLR